jgi:hypothetical protein
MANKTTATEKPPRYKAYYERFGHKHSVEFVCNSEQEAREFLAEWMDLDPTTITLHKVM